MLFSEGSTVGERLRSWRALASAGKKPSTQHYHEEIAGIIERHWPDLTMQARSATLEQVAEFIGRVAHYSAPRFNAIVSCLRVFVPGASQIKRRAVHPKHVQLPGQREFVALLAEIDKLIAADKAPARPAVTPVPVKPSAP